MTTLHQLLLLLGLFVVPLILLMSGHRIKRSSSARQRLFWGAVTGHIVALLLALGASLWPPTGWLPTDTWRGALGVWSLVVLPIVGALVAFLGTRRTTS